MGAKSDSRGNTKITLVAIHTNEGSHPPGVMPDRTAEDLARYLDGAPSSYHVIVDDDSVIRYLPENVGSWSLRSGNARSLNLCFTGWAKWGRGDWLRHDPMLRLGATVVRDWCAKYGIPPRKLTPAQVGANQTGVIGHVDWTIGKSDGTHWDPGPQFPWDLFMQYVTGGARSGPGGVEDMAFDDKFTDWNKQPQTVFSWMMHVDQRLAELAGPDEGKGASKRVDVGFARDQIRGDMALLMTAVRDMATVVASIKADTGSTAK